MPGRFAQLSFSLSLCQRYHGTWQVKADAGKKRDVMCVCMGSIRSNKVREKWKEGAGICWKEPDAQAACLEGKEEMIFFFKRDWWWRSAKRKSFFSFKFKP